MPKPLQLPYGAPIPIITDHPLTWREIESALEEDLVAGVSFVVLRAHGPPNRGGYFFHLRKNQDGQYLFSTFDRADVCRMKDGARCAEFINHVAGLAYSEEMWHVAQRVNLRTDAD